MMIIWGTGNWYTIEDAPSEIDWPGATRAGGGQAPAGGVLAAGGSAAQIFRSIYDPTQNSLRFIDVGAPSGLNGGGHMDAEQIIKSVFSKADNKIRVVQV